MTTATLDPTTTATTLPAETAAPPLTTWRLSLFDLCHAASLPPNRQCPPAEAFLFAELRHDDGRVLRPYAKESDASRQGALSRLDGAEAAARQGEPFAKLERLEKQKADAQRQAAEAQQKADAALARARECLARGTDPSKDEQAYAEQAAQVAIYENRVSALAGLEAEAKAACIQLPRDARRVAAEQLQADADAGLQAVRAAIREALLEQLPEYIRHQAVRRVAEEALQALRRKR